MKILIGTSNISRRSSAAKIRSTSARLTLALAQRPAAGPDDETHHPARALKAALSKRARQKVTSPRDSRRDMLAAAKAAALMRGWPAR
jgi:hypothetical protein